MLQGARPGALGSVAGYVGTLKSAGGVPGQAGAFQTLVRIRRVEGGPVPPWPDITIEGAAARIPPPLLTYSSCRVSAFNDPYCDIAIQGRLAGPITRPIALAVDLTQSREVPWFKRLLCNMSLWRYSEINARSRLGTFVLQPTPVRKPNFRSQAEGK